jgi:3-hydroxyisobutyrate dehydrogenase-like beta-hydroxyacid dehydrogenase
MAEVAVLGMGRMGSAMARRLAGAGHSVVVWNRNHERAEAVARSAPGRLVARRDPAEAIRGCSVVVSMLADGHATREVLLHTDLMQALSPGVVVCDLGTSGPAAAADVGAALTAAGVQYLDAPVSGSIPAVDSGTLLVMAGGTPLALKAARPVLGALADRIVLVGGHGAGQAMKLAVNLVVHDLNAALSESLQLAEKAGITRELAYDVLEQSVVGAPFVRYKRQAFLDEASPVAMNLGLSLKDLRLITEFARELGVATRVTDAARDQAAAACEAGLAEADMAGLSRFR